MTFKSSKLVHLLTIAGLLLFVVVCIWLLNLSPEGGASVEDMSRRARRNEFWRVPAALAGIMFFGLLFLAELWKFFTLSIELRFDEYGLTYTPFGPAPIEWEQITCITMEPKLWTVCLSADRYGAIISKMPFVAKIVHKVNHRFGFTGLFIPSIYFGGQRAAIISQLNKYLAEIRPDVWYDKKTVADIERMRAETESVVEPLPKIEVSAPSSVWASARSSKKQSVQVSNLTGKKLEYGRRRVR